MKQTREVPKYQICTVLWVSIKANKTLVSGNLQGKSLRFYRFLSGELHLELHVLPLTLSSPSMTWLTAANLHQFETVWIRQQKVMSAVNVSRHKSPIMFLLADTLQQSSRWIDEAEGHPCSWCHIFHLPAQSLNEIWRNKQTHWLHKLFGRKCQGNLGWKCDMLGQWYFWYLLYFSPLSPLFSVYLLLLSLCLFEKAPDPLCVRNICRKRSSICIWIWHSHDSPNEFWGLRHSTRQDISHS